MNMKQNVAKMAVVAAVLMTVALTPSVASAQRAFEGRFTLTTTTYWGNTALPAGDYRLQIKPANSSVDVITVKGAKEVMCLAFTQLSDSSKEGYITLSTSNGVAVARDLHIGGGPSFNLPTSKARRELAANATTLVKIQIVAAE